jgi:hypothetical protein
MSVYFIQAETGGPIKIGYAADELKRFQNIQTSHHETLVLRHAILGDIETERSIHKRFRQWRIRGEWFFPGPELAKFARAKPVNVGHYAEQARLAQVLEDFMEENGIDLDGADMLDMLDSCGLLLIDRAAS